MPYKGEFANKASYVDIIKNPDVAEFLKSCSYLRKPTDEEIRDIVGAFSDRKVKELGDDPLYLIATDGSFYESSINESFPSTKVAYVKFGTILIDLKEYRNLDHLGSGLLDPFKVAALEDNNRSVTLTVPSCNIVLNGKKTVADSFRYALDTWFKDKRTTIDDDDKESSLIYTLADLESRKSGGKSQSGYVTVHKCPTCKDPETRDIQVPLIDPISCPVCNSQIYSTDCLRLWEEISEYQSNGTVLGRLMMLVEHILPVHYIRYLMRHNPKILGSTVFFLDGPLALFGTVAWLHAPIMKFINEVRQRLNTEGISEPLLIGLQKSGQVSDFAKMLDSNLSNSSLLLLDDEYRYRYVLNGRKPADKCFGDETYYGQDFIFKTANGRTFVIGVPYPLGEKRPLNRFIESKNNTSGYFSLDKILSVIQNFESDLYENAVVPVALAHKYTSISLSPGGKILDILSRSIVK